MESRQSLLDYAMNKQTKPEKDYTSIQELLFGPVRPNSRKQPEKDCLFNKNITE